MNMKKGFTLIEIMIVVAILAILAAVAIPNFISYRKTSQMNACIANLKQLDTATEAYRIKHNTPDAKPTQDQLKGTDGAGFIKKVMSCPDGVSSYSAPTDSTSHWTCGNTDTEYPHAITD